MNQSVTQARLSMVVPVWFENILASHKTYPNPFSS